MTIHKTDLCLDRLRYAGGILGLLLMLSPHTRAAPSLSQQVQRIVEKLELEHATFGVEVLSLDTGKVVLSIDGDKLFTPGSTTKLLTEGAALELLGPDYRFATRLYRTGAVLPDGTLDGDLVWVASGDPNISGRIRSDGTLAFENEDHAYAGILPGARAVPGDPLLVVRDLARQVAARGIKSIKGRILVDVSLFPEGAPEAGSGAVISPVTVNDNIVDVTLEPGAVEGSAASLQVSPISSYVRFNNRVTTAAAGSKGQIGITSDIRTDGGSHEVTLEGSLPLGKGARLVAYKVSQPGRFARQVLTQALQDLGVEVGDASEHEDADFQALASSYTADHVVAEHDSPPLREEVKVTLKVSQNLHASMTPYILGATLRPNEDDPLQAGLDLERSFLEQAGLDLSAASQSDGAGGPAAAFTPDFLCRYLAYMATRPTAALFAGALPVLGRDGTLRDASRLSPAAGHVAAKTGTAVLYDALNRNLIVVGKGLAGYITTASGKKLAFAAFINHASVGPDIKSVEKVGDALAEIAVTVYESMP